MGIDKLAIVLSTHPAQFSAVAYKGEIATNLTKIAGWGYKGVELAIRDPALVGVDQLSQVLEASGLRVPAIGTGQAWGEERLSLTSSEREVRRAAIERIKSHLALAESLNAMVIIGLIRGVTPPGQTHSRSMEYLLDSLRECLEAAKSMGVKFALEPINRYETDLINSTAEGLELIDRLKSEQIGLLLDTFHMNIEELAIETSIRSCGERIFHFHVADSNRMCPGTGHLNFKSIFRALSATGYPGWISGEFMPGPDPDAAAQACIAFLHDLY